MPRRAGTLGEVKVGQQLLSLPFYDDFVTIGLQFSLVSFPSPVAFVGEARFRSASVAFYLAGKQRAVRLFKRTSLNAGQA